MKTVTVDKTINHPLEELLGLPSHSTIVPVEVAEPVEVVEHVLYDDKDKEVEERIEEVYTSAMDLIRINSDKLETADGKAVACITESTAALLNVALSAAREKRELKRHKDKMTTAPAGGVGGVGNTVNNNILVTTRNDIMKMIRDASRKDDAS